MSAFELVRTGTVCPSFQLVTEKTPNVDVQVIVIKTVITMKCSLQKANTEKNA